jgi:hypothetical protein
LCQNETPVNVALRLTLHDRVCQNGTPVNGSLRLTLLALEIRN